MNINGVDSNSVHETLPSAHAQGRNKSQGAEDATAKGKSAAIQDSEGNGAKVKGVVRLLQEGHFKGVADVRLRINFFDELTAIAHGDLSEALNASSPDLLSAVDEALDGLLNSGELTSEQETGVTEARDAFAAQVQQLMDDFNADGGADTSTLTGGIQEAFDAFAETLSALLGGTSASEETTAVEEEVVLDTEGEASEPSVLEAFVEELRATFEAAFATLTDQLSAANPLPELSPPSGNGVAYEKFLAMYNALMNPGVDASEISENAIDTIA